MFLKVAVLMWIISISTLIISLEKKLKDKYLLIASQIYNFMTGFLSWIIYGISIIFVLKYSNGAFDKNPLMGLILPILPVLLLLIPININIKKKINFNTTSYVVISILTTILGLGMFIFLGNYLDFYTI